MQYSSYLKPVTLSRWSPVTMSKAPQSWKWESVCGILYLWQTGQIWRSLCFEIEH